MGYKDYKRKIVEDRARRKEVLGREKERLDEVKENLKGELPKHPNPIPQDRVTFDHYKKIYKNVKKGGDKAGKAIIQSSNINFFQDRNTSAENLGLLRVSQKNGRRQ